MEELVTLVMAIQLYVGHSSCETSLELMMLCGFKEKTHPTGLGVYIFIVDVVYAHGYFNNLLTPIG